MHYTTDKGDIGVAVVSADLIKKGLDVLQPLSSSLPFDLVVHYEGRFFKIQVKYRKIKKGCVTFGLTRAVITNSNVKKRRIKRNEVDIFAVYCPDNNQCYYINSKAVQGITDVSLRIQPTKTKQKKRIRMAIDYLEPTFNRKVPGSIPGRSTQKYHGTKNI
jgi:hypothetical protein